MVLIIFIIGPEDKRSKVVKYFYTKLGPIIEEYSSKYVSTVNLYSNFTRNLSLGVRDIKEKGAWISTEIIDKPGSKG